MTLTFQGKCDRCPREASWTSRPEGTGNAPPEVNCPRCDGRARAVPLLKPTY